MADRLTGVQNPGVYRRPVGDLTVIAINDGQIGTDFAHIVGADRGACESVHRAAFRAVPPWLTLNTFLVESRSRLLLVDAGFGSEIPETGRLIANLAQIGIRPDDIDTVLMTHIHRDHGAGLIGSDGAALFRNAELIAHEDELAFWRDDATLGRLSEMQKADFSLARAVLAAYRDRTRGVRDQEVAPGVSPVATPGHTPGHTAWRISSGSDQLLIWGDIIHLPSIQFAMPQASVLYDVDSAAAATARERVLDMAARDGMAVAGIHLDFPAFGHVRSEGPGRYAYVPDAWVPVLSGGAA